MVSASFLGSDTRQAAERVNVGNRIVGALGRLGAPTGHGGGAFRAQNARPVCVRTFS